MEAVIPEFIVILVILLIGVVLGKTGFFQDGVMDGINHLAMNLTFPALILASMDKEFTLTLLHNSLFLMLLSGLCFAAVIVWLELWRKRSKGDVDRLNLYQFLVLVGNTAFIGFPIVQAVYGDTGLFYASVFNIAHNFILFSYACNLFLRGKGKQRIPLKKVFLNPGFLATVAGFVVFLLPCTLPYVVHRTAQWLGDMTIPLCLLVVGARLGKSRLSEIIKPPAIWFTSLARLVLFPGLMIPIFYLCGLRGELAVIPVIIFATPTALLSGTFAQAYHNDGLTGSKAVILSNLLSMVTLPLVVFVCLRMFSG